MRAPIPAMTVLAMTMLASAYAPCALAQVVGETGPNVKLFANSKDVLALIDKVKADRKEGQPLISAPIIALAPYRAMLEYRAAKAPAALHETEAEMMYVIEGAGTIVTGGKLVDEKRNNPENLSGTDISGGSAQAITKGDFLVVPQNTPHQIAPTGGAPIILMTLHVPRKAAAQ
jgi:mannose-6-phosphate isomerase-like protein (cupin superfamily)